MLQFSITASTILEINLAFRFTIFILLLASGTDLLLRAGESISKIVEAKYHILSFDPRGVNLTSPPLECFETSGDGVRFARDIEHLGLPFEVGGASNDSRAKEAWAKKVSSN